jgi:hypothetical protein
MNTEKKISALIAGLIISLFGLGISIAYGQNTTIEEETNIAIEDSNFTEYINELQNFANGCMFAEQADQETRL